MKTTFFSPVPSPALNLMCLWDGWKRASHPSPCLRHPQHPSQDCSWSAARLPQAWPSFLWACPEACFRPSLLHQVSHLAVSFLPASSALHFPHNMFALREGSKHVPLPPWWPSLMFLSQDSLPWLIAHQHLLFLPYSAMSSHAFSRTPLKTLFPSVLWVTLPSQPSNYL